MTMIRPGEAMLRAVGQVKRERGRQYQLGLDRGWESDCADPNASVEQSFVVLSEELGEVARAILEGEGDVALYTELTQVAAVAVAMMEAAEARLA